MGTFGSFKGTFYAEHRTQPTEQEIYDAGVKEGMRRTRTEQGLDAHGNKLSELPPNYCLVPVWEAVKEPDFDECAAQADHVTGVKAPAKAWLNIFIREVRRWITHREAGYEQQATELIGRIDKLHTAEIAREEVCNHSDDRHELINVLGITYLVLNRMIHSRDGANKVMSNRINVLQQQLREKDSIIYQMNQGRPFVEAVENLHNKALTNALHSVLGSIRTNNEAITVGEGPIRRLCENTIKCLDLLVKQAEDGRSIDAQHIEAVFYGVRDDVEAAKTGIDAITQPTA